MVLCVDTVTQSGFVLLANLTGSSALPPFPFITTLNAARVQFTSDGTLASSGFQVLYAQYYQGMLD